MSPFALRKLRGDRYFCGAKGDTWKFIDRAILNHLSFLTLVIRMSRTFLAIGLMASCFVGCGDGGPQTFTVNGTVTSKEKPLETGTISFEDSKAGRANSATIGSGGKYTVKLPTGNYKVMLLPITKERVSADGTMEEAMVDENKFPKKYRTSDTSGLSLKVSDNASFDVELK